MRCHSRGCCPLLKKWQSCRKRILQWKEALKVTTVLTLVDVFIWWNKCKKASHVLIVVILPNVLQFLVPLIDILWKQLNLADIFKVYKVGKVRSIIVCQKQWVNCTSFILYSCCSSGGVKYRKVKKQNKLSQKWNAPSITERGVQIKWEKTGWREWTYMSLLLCARRTFQHEWQF